MIVHRSLVLRLALAGVLLPAPVSAHQYWLAPSRYDAPPHAAVEVGAFAGTGFRGEPKPWSPSRCVRFVARTSQVIDLSRGAAPGATTWARFAPADAGGAMLAYESDFASIELPAAEFEAYLADEGLTGPLAARRQAHAANPGRERYRRCAKTWLAGGNATRATTPFGLPLEVVPETIPGATSSLRVRLLWSGAPLAGARLKAWRSACTPDGAPLDAAVRDSVGMAWEGSTDAHGEATVPCRMPGEWIVSAVWMQPSQDEVVADWESTWASLTFARAAPNRKGD